MKKNNEPNGVLFTPEFQETVKRLNDKEPELAALVSPDSQTCQADTDKGACEDEKTPAKS